MSSFVVPVFSIIILLWVGEGLSLQCLTGSGLPLPSLFKEIQNCSSDEVCFIHRTEANLFSGGCRFKASCPGSSPALIGKKQAIPSTDCTNCCSGDFCNNHGCGAFVLSKPSRGSMCFDCRFINDPSQCTDVTMCKAGHVCTTRLSTEFPGYYQQACVSETTCPSTYTTPYCSDVNATCCDGDFCNNACLPGSPPTPGPALTYREQLRRECMTHSGDGYIYDSLSNLCVRVVKDEHQSYTRQEAEDTCRQDNAALMSVTNVDEQDFLLVWIFRHHLNDTDYWVSAKTKVSGSHDFYWADSSPVQYNHWGSMAVGQPDDLRKGDQDCVFLNHMDNYFWHDDKCEASKSGYICEIWNVTGDDKVRRCRHLILSGYNYDPTSDLCIKLHQGQSDVTFTHQQAVDDCMKDGADLVTIDNSNKTDAILSWIFSSHANDTDLWIGATDKYNTSVFYWPNGHKLAYTHWGNVVTQQRVPSQPDGIGNEECVYLNHQHDYHWFDEDCAAFKTGFICEIFDNDTDSLVETCHQRLFDGYFYDAFSNDCIKVVTSSGGLNRENARAKCIADGADLVIIDSDSKTDFVLQWIFNQRLNGTDFWIGGKDISQNGQFYWEHSDVPFSYTNWFTVKSKDCVYLDSLDTYHWKASVCDNQTHGYICQINQYTMGTMASLAANGTDVRSDAMPITDADSSPMWIASET